MAPMPPLSGSAMSTLFNVTSLPPLPQQTLIPHPTYPVSFFPTAYYYYSFCLLPVPHLLPPPRSLPRPTSCSSVSSTGVKNFLSALFIVVSPASRSVNGHGWHSINAHNSLSRNFYNREDKLALHPFGITFCSTHFACFSVTQVKESGQSCTMLFITLKFFSSIKFVFMLDSVPFLDVSI